MTTADRPIRMPYPPFWSPTGDADRLHLWSQDQTVIVPSPFAPDERVVVGPWLATRELLHALWRFPAYRLLVIAGLAVRLSEKRGTQLTEANATPPDVEIAVQLRRSAVVPLPVPSRRRPPDKLAQRSRSPPWPNGLMAGLAGRG
jgi:hypothetical protein